MKDRDKALLTATSLLVIGSLTCSLDAPAVPPTATPDASGPDTAEFIPAPEMQVTSGVLAAVTETAKHDEIVSTLPADRPGTEGGSSQIKTYTVTAGGEEFSFAMYQISQESLTNQKPIQLTDAEGNITQVVEGVALYVESHSYDGSSQMVRLIAIPVPTDSGDGVSWVFDADGYPTKDGEGIDLSRPVFAYNLPIKQDSVLSFAPLTTEPSEVVKFNTPNPLSITFDGNETPPAVIVETSFETSVGVPVTAELTSTPEPATPIPEISFNCPKNPDLPMSNVTYEDISSGRLAKWVLESPQGKAPISSDYQNLVFGLSDLSDTGDGIALSVRSTEFPGYAEKYTNYIGMCAINPSEFGIEGKNDGVLIISVMQDRLNNRAALFTLVSASDAKDLYNKLLNDPHNGVSPRLEVNPQSTAANLLIEDGAKSGGPGDLRELSNGEILHVDKSNKLMDKMFDAIDQTNEFSPFEYEGQQYSSIDIFNTTVFLPYKWQDITN